MRACVFGQRGVLCGVYSSFTCCHRFMYRVCLLLYQHIVRLLRAVSFAGNRDMRLHSSTDFEVLRKTSHIFYFGFLHFFPPEYVKGNRVSRSVSAATLHACLCLLLIAALIQCTSVVVLQEQLSRVLRLGIHAATASM